MSKKYGMRLKVKKTKTMKITKRKQRLKIIIKNKH